jgi:upstream-binding transcription factor
MSKEKKSKKINENESLKKNKSSYMFFCMDERSNIKTEKPELNNKEIVIELGSRWNELKQNNQERFKYYDNLALKDKERYLNEKNLKNSVVENKVSTPPVKDKKNDEKKTKKSKKIVKESELTEKIEKISEEVTEQKQKKTRVNGYINFCKKMRDVIKTKNSNFTAKDIQQELSKLWKELSDSEKEEYKN